MSEPLRRRDSAISIATAGVVVCALVSDNLLVWLGVPYNIPSGPLVAKIHPGTWLIAAAFAWLMSDGNPWGNLAAACRRSPSVTLLFASALVALFATTLEYGTSGSAFVIDTLIAPCMLAFILRGAEESRLRRLFTILVAVYAANALVGIGEALLARRIVPYMAGDVPLVEEHFRATAFGGHPLNNAFRTAVMLCALLAYERKGVVSALVVLFAVALLAFGSRSALVLGFAVLAGWGAVQALRGLFRGGGGGGSLIVVAGLIASPLAAWWLDLGQRISETFFWDESAQSRLLAFKLLDYIDAYDLWFGIGAGKVLDILQRLKGATTLTDLENFWLLLLAQFGLVVFVPLALGLLGTIVSLAREGGTPTRLAALVFLILASSNNSLATKSQALVLLVPVLLGSAAVRRRQPAETAAAPSGGAGQMRGTLLRLPPGASAPPRV